MKVGTLIKVTRNWRMGAMTFEHLVGKQGTVTEIHGGDVEGWARIRVGHSEGSAPIECLTELKSGPI